jgi:hypothetical protein
MSPSGIDRATFQLVAQCLNQLPHHVSRPNFNQTEILSTDFCYIAGINLQENLSSGRRVAPCGCGTDGRTCNVMQSAAFRNLVNALNDLAISDREFSAPVSRSVI